MCYARFRFLWLRRFYAFGVFEFNFVEGFAVLWLRRFYAFGVSEFQWLRRLTLRCFNGFAVSGFMFNVQRFDDLASLS